tara:strand:+ start:445 stop:1194 length:750 start_codon:yes stop_codon:yes gene_type:complete
METKEKLEHKDRHYYLTNHVEPLTFKLGSRHTNRHPLMWFDDDQGYQRELRYATNQKSCFVDQQNGPVTLEHIIFENGTLHVPKNKRNLQELLSLYHPHKGRLYEEYDAVVEAVDELKIIHLEIEALNIANTMEVDKGEAILRVEQGSSVSNLSSKEIKRDILIFAKRNPALFINLCNDENVELRNFAIKATEANIIKLSSDQRIFSWASNGRKLMNVPFEENPYSAFAVWLKTDEGVEVFKSIDKKLK